MLKCLNFHFEQGESGYIAVLSTILVLVAMTTVGISMAALAITQQKIASNVVKSAKAYFAAEAGIEDAILRIKDGLSTPASYTLTIGDGSANIQIADPMGGSRTITSQGEVSDNLRKIQAVYGITTEQVSFYYGAQIGEGGMEMGNNAQVKGNVFSNGTVLAPTGVGYIQNSIVVAGNGNRIEGLDVGEDAKVHTCKDSEIAGNLTYVSGGSVQNCTAGGLINSQPNEIAFKDLPIPQSAIDGWKTDAEAGGVISGNYVLDGGVTVEFGPKKITGNLTVDNNSTLIMTGTVWVVGNVTVSNGAVVKLDPDSYWGVSGVLISDGKIQIRPGVSLEGSGLQGSYLLLLSTNSSLDKTSPAIEVDNTTTGGIFYTTQGLIVVKNNVEAREVTGYKVFLEQNAEINYETGLIDAEFSSGPGGSWQVISWQEID